MIWLQDIKEPRITNARTAPSTNSIRCWRLRFARSNFFRFNFTLRGVTWYNSLKSCYTDFRAVGWRRGGESAFERSSASLALPKREISTIRAQRSSRPGTPRPARGRWQLTGNLISIAIYSHFAVHDAEQARVSSRADRAEPETCRSASHTE